MRIACLRGSPAGLYFVISVQLRNPDREVGVFERSKADDTFGWGVVPSDDALENMERNAPASAKSIRGQFAYWDDIVVVHKGTRTVSGGHGFADIDIRECKFIWLGTHQTFDDAFTVIFEKTQHGWIWAHAYQFDKDTATFIVECPQDTWGNFCFEHMSISGNPGTAHP